jgi:hypothetical protein
MKSPEEILSELFFCDPSSHYFAECLQVTKPLEAKVLGVYSQRLDACDMKIRFAAKSFLENEKIIRELQHGEFIYFDDQSRLSMNFYTESFVIFLRAALDLSISAYDAYFNEKTSTSIDSFNNFIKQVSKIQEKEDQSTWIPANSLSFWSNLFQDYALEEGYMWLHALVGKSKGRSLRDLVIHRQNVYIDTWIDDNDRGRFVIGLTKDSMGYVMPWLEHIFESSQKVIGKVKEDILASEEKFKKQ